MMTRSRGPIPPVILLGFIAAQVLLHYYLPVLRIVPPPWHLSGIALIGAGIGIILVPAGAFSRAGTTIKPFEESSSLVVRGPYRYTRNPMYVGMVVILIGVAVLTGSLSPFAMPVLFVPVLNARVVRHEEAMLEERFGVEYRAYREKVRRWL